MWTEGKNIVNAGAAADGVYIPEEAREMVRSVKEVVNNCTDSDIYGALIDSNMNPDDAVQILLRQDTFHEVKSKRQRRKEISETLEPRARGTCGGYRGLRISGEQDLGSSLSQSSSSYNDAGQASYRRGSGSVPHILPSSSDSFIADNKVKNEGTGSTITSAKPSLGSQTEWLAGTSGHLSTADIVRRGRPQDRSSQMETATSHTAQDANSQDSSPHDLEMPFDSPMDKFNTSSISGIQMFSDESYVCGNEANSPEGVQELEEDAASNNNVNIDGVASLSSESAFHMGMHERHEGIERISQSIAANDSTSARVSAAPANLEQLSLGEKPMAHSSTDNRVVFPKYLQALAAACPNLSFGTYRPSDLAAKSSPLASNSLEDNSKQQASGAIYGPSVGFLETRNSGHHIKNFHDEQLGFMPDSRGQTTNIINHQIPISPEAQLIRQSIPKVAHGHGYTSPSSLPHSNMKNRWEPSSSWPLLRSPAARNVPLLPRELMLNSSSQTSLKSNAPALSGADLATGSVLPQRQSVHSCLQHALSLEELVRLNNSLAFTHEPSALQQSYQDSRTLHESLAGMKGSCPWFRGGVPRSSLPSIPSYGGLGAPYNFHRGFRHNLVSPLAGSNAGYDDTLLSQSREGNFNAMLQQKNDDSSALEYGPHFRQMSIVYDSISSTGENRVLSRYQPGQRLSQGLGYPTGYHPQAGTTDEQRWQSPGDFAFSNLQGPSTNQPHRRRPWSS